MASDTGSKRIIKVTQRGQATLPKEWRDRLGIDAPGEVVMIAVDDSIVVKPVRSIEEVAGRHAGTFEEGEVRSTIRQLRNEETERERDDERLHGLDRQDDPKT